uniref:B30.2/SPRY domain-containing protein n=1 Tax=Xiphophorus maculatus TaxID=8083 RepID=A0A3B5PTV6_XIPMA
MSWSLSCSDEGRYSVCHQNKREFISSCSSSAPYHKVGVYVDYPGGTLSFYRVSSEIPIHLHTLKTEFTQPLYPGFGFWTGSSYDHFLLRSLVPPSAIGSNRKQ